MTVNDDVPVCRLDERPTGVRGKPNAEVSTAA
jgi:hypothetical protein